MVYTLKPRDVLRLPGGTLKLLSVGASAWVWVTPDRGKPRKVELTRGNRIPVLDNVWAVFALSTGGRYAAVLRIDGPLGMVPVKEERA